MSTYKQKKEIAREKAIKWQYEMPELSLSWDELAKVGEYFRKIGKRYGLIREFQENGIPC